MSARLRIVRVFGLLLFSVAAVTGCNDSESTRVQETRERLVGTWLREIETRDEQARRVLVLAGDGTFSESLRAELFDGRIQREEASGEWAYDGTNLKRRYTREDGHQVRGIGHFVTFALTSLTPREFEASNQVQGKDIRYRRVPPGTQP
jgi:hypothetical protein